MIALSTSYFTNHDTETSGGQIAQAVRDMGFQALELEYRLSPAQLKGLRPFLSRGEIQAWSVHNPFPRASDISPRAAKANRVRFSSLDREERNEAVRLGEASLKWARDLGADTVVLHLGRVEAGTDLDPLELERMARRGQRETAEYEEMRDRVAAARLASLGGHRDAVLSSLDRLSSEAVKCGVRLGLENRYHPMEIPDKDDLEVIFRELRGAPLGYWHDSGHGASLEYLGFLSSQAGLLETFQDRILGLHLHDARGLNDHLAPGEGELDFAALAELVGSASHLVMEVHPPAEPDAVTSGRKVLEKAGFGAVPTEPRTPGSE
jgi:sugar phosphate isomerase/epimerase